MYPRYGFLDFCGIKLPKQKNYCTPINGIDGFKTDQIYEFEYRKNDRVCVRSESGWIKYFDFREFAHLFIADSRKILFKIIEERKVKT